MLRQRIYYLLKPFLPWGLRMGVRRVLARRKLATCKAVWPIDESAAAAPADWPGWPGGKKFAFVLTHDVEGPEGLAKCRQLAELEMELGFRSSFNFIPEGPYRVTPALRTWLTDNGFEVGVHDLQHNGKLFQSRRSFKRKAARINHYLHEWGAAGFRAGFMLRNLDWLHDLDIRYDASTFDTDPLEPQSDGAGTIFPFWIPVPPASALSQPPFPHPPQASSSNAHVRGGYVELPYSLPQDSTLFLVLEETSPEIWLRKLDWIAGHGGMGLVNVHPDYVRFDGEKTSPRTIPVRMYAELLDHVRKRYSGQYWRVLPRELAAWFTETTGVSRSSVAVPIAAEVTGLRGKRAAVLLYSSYPSDPRPRRAAETMIAAGMKVDLLCLAEDDAGPREEVVSGVRVTRIRMKRRRDSEWAYFWQYGRFFLSAFWFLLRKGLRKKYDIVHVHNMPDFLVFAALIPKLLGSRIILDLHDPMPELMMTIYGLNPTSWRVGLLRRLERWSIGFAHLVLTPNLAFKNLFVARGCPVDKIQIIMNSPQPEIFDPPRPASAGGPNGGTKTFRVMHHGLIAHRHGVDILVQAIARVRSKIPDVQLDIYGGRTPFLDVVLDDARRLGVADIVHYHGPKTQTEIAAAIRQCALGVVPNRRSTFTETNFPTRLFEYLAMHRPVIAPSTQGIRDYFGDGQMLFFEPGDVADLAARILWVWEHPVETREIVRTGIEIYRQHLWSQEKVHFVNLVSTLCVRT